MSIGYLLQEKTFPTSNDFLKILIDIVPQGECLTIQDSWLDKSLFPRELLSKGLIAHHSQ